MKGSLAPHLDRLWEFVSFRKSLRAKVTLGIVLPSIIILGAFTIIEYTRHREVVLKNLAILAAQSGKVVENSLRHAMLESDFAEVQILIDSLGETEEFRVLYLLDPDSKVIFAPKKEGVGTILNSQGSDCQPCHSLPVAERPESVIISVEEGQRVFRSMQPIENSPSCSQCHDPTQRIIGLLLTDIPINRMEAALATDLRENLLWWAGTILVSIIIVNVALNRLVLSHLNRLAHALASISQGQSNQPLPIKNEDEIGKLSKAFNAMVQRIEAETAANRSLSNDLKRQSELRGELLKRLITAQEDERKRVARELHDGLGQALGGLALRAEATERFVASDPDSAREQLQETKSLIDETMNQMYNMILDLRPAALDDLGLVAAVRAHTDRTLGGTDIAYTLDIDAFDARLTPAMETCLYRTFQEALQNIVRHSAAKRVHLSLTCQNGEVEGEIIDDGRGFDPKIVFEPVDSERGLGLLGMQERVTLCGGNLRINSQPGKGTHIQICIPLTETTHE